MKNFEVDKILITGEAPVLQSDLGIQPNQIPLNKDLGSLAYMDAPQLEDVNVDTLKLREMAAEISDDIVDVFIYDTNNDSDGGKWRERTQHTSWYNEELNTATRGGRREFPAVAVIVAEANKVTIYDGDDPDLSMWMVFEAQYDADLQNCKLLTWAYNPGGLTSCGFLNGLLGVGLGDNGGLIAINFVKDFSRYYREDGSSYTGAIYSGDISTRNTTSYSWVGDYDELSIVNDYVNDVAMTVLPNAPIDDDTGLPVPTIAVATDGGVSVIKDDGSVVDITSSQGSSYNYSRFVSFDNNNNKLLFGMDSSTRNTSRRVHWHDIPNSDKTIDVNGITSELYTTNATNSDVPDAVGEDQAFALNGAVAGSLGLTKVERDDNRFAFITSSYNTGWMPGDIKLATLSDTKAEVIGSLGEELITNGTFDTDVSGWTLIDPTASPDATITWNNGVAEIFRPNGQGARFYQAFNTIIGREYAVSAGVNVGGYYIADSIDSSSWNIIANDGAVILDTSAHRFFATSNVSYFVLNSTTLNTSHSFDNISAKQTSELITNGTFNNGTTGWTNDGMATFEVSSAQAYSGANSLHVIADSNTDGVYQNFAVESGKDYVFTAAVYQATTAAYRIRIGDVDSGSSLYSTGDVETHNGTWKIFNIKFTAEGTTAQLLFAETTTANACDLYIDAVSVRLAEEDRSVNDNGLQVFGEIDKTPVAPGADLVAYSGFSTENYLVQPYNPDLDFGTGDFCVSFWFNYSGGGWENLFCLGNASFTGSLSDAVICQLETSADRMTIYINNQTVGWIDTGLVNNIWNHYTFKRESGNVYQFLNGKLMITGVDNYNITGYGKTDWGLRLGHDGYNDANAADGSKLALFRISATAPTAEQIAKIYRDEKVLFQDGAQTTLYGTSDAVTALAYDDKTELLHVGTASGRSDFNGLRRVNNTTTAVTTAISANNKLIAEQ